MLDSCQWVKMSMTVTKKTHFQESHDPDEFDMGFINACSKHILIIYFKKKIYNKKIYFLTIFSFFHKNIFKRND